MVLEPIHFGDDQLTEKRAINIQIALSNGSTLYEMLEGLMPKFEDWHLNKFSTLSTRYNFSDNQLNALS